MGKYEEKIHESSVWISVTPTPLARTLPFYVTETGFFTAQSDYVTKREFHDSFLLIYTITGEGSASLGRCSVSLPKGCAVLLDCHEPHEYRAVNGEWEFMWVHMKGDGVRAMYDILYPSGEIRAAEIKNRNDFRDMLSQITDKASKTEIFAAAEVSAMLHLILSRLGGSLMSENMRGKKPSEDISEAVAFIEENYAEPITVDDMVESIHLSKYHFIRRFKSIMGITPYSYLMTYRINMSKTFLRETDKTVSEIAELCGFLDTSNFIIQFKKHTGQKPAQYRRDFV